MPQENCLIWNFSATRFAYVSKKSLTKALKLLKMFKKWGLRETGASYEQRFNFTDNQWQNIWPKVRISKKKKKKRARSENFDICFCVSCNHQTFIFRPANGEFHQSFLTYRGNIRRRSKISWFYINLKCNDWFGEAMVLSAKWFCWEYP